MLINQAWRAAYKGGHDLRFNPPLEYIQIQKQFPCIHFVHTGKCAGGSIFRSLKSDTKDIVLLHYHVFDAGECLSYAIDSLQDCDEGNHFFIVASRDPLKRWESSFNWDLHNLILKKNIPIEKSPLANYANINFLAQGIADGESDALQLGRWGHMGKGLNFYAPSKELERIDESKIFVIRTENINQDYNSFLDLLPAKYLDSKINDLKLKTRHQVKIARSKDKYKDDYPSGTFYKLQESYVKNIKEFLADDYTAHDYLTSRARNLKM